MVGYRELAQNIKINRNEGILIPEEILDIIAMVTNETSGKTLIPNINFGELALGQRNVTSFSTTNVDNNFLNVNIQEKFEKIIMFSPIGWQKGDHPYRAEIEYFAKALPLLANNGIFVAIVAQNFLSAPLFKTVRERILSLYSLEAVIDLGAALMPFSNVSFSLLLIKNKLQAKTVFLSALSQNPQAIQQYQANIGECWHPFEEITDRFDVKYYDKEYSEIRKAILDRDTVHLSDIAKVFPGALINAREHFETGKYIIIKPQHIHDGKVHLGNNLVSYCSEEFFASASNGENALLCPGDIVVSLVGKINWAIYNDKSDIAIANHNVAIIRAYKTNQELFDLFFSSDVGIKYLETQLKFFSHYGVFRHISIHDLRKMAVPDMQTMQKAAKIASFHEYEAKVSEAFSSIGWDVEEYYKVDNFCFDLALKSEGQLRAIIELKQYSAQEILRNDTIISQFECYQSIIPNVALLLFVDERIYCYRNKSFVELTGFPHPNEDIFNFTSFAISKETQSETAIIHSSGFESAISHDVLLAALNGKLAPITEKLNLLLNGQSRIENKLDDISRQIEELAHQIAGYQSLVSRQLEMVTSEDEEDRIIHAFSEECTERIIHELSKKSSNDAFQIEQHKLEKSFGQSAWSKLSEQSRTFLISSKVVFNSLIMLQDKVDYSGVCLLVTKSLELELSRRFCTDFISFLKQRYRKEYSQYPTTLLDRYGKPIKAKHFTLGSVAYVLCYEKAVDLSDTAFDNNKQKLLEFCSERILIGKDYQSIEERLTDLAIQIETVKNEYRNPAAHTNELKYVKAQECFNLILDVERLLQKMLDSFAY